MKKQWFRSNWANGGTQSVVLRLGLVSMGLLLSTACGSRVQNTLGGETGFLDACRKDSDCQSGLCACGVCTQTCTETETCGDRRAVCSTELAGNACQRESRDVCVLRETPSAPTSEGGPGTCQDGSCGDEVCEAGEGITCGCASGCQSTTSDTTTGSTSTSDEAETSPRPCEGFACEVQLDLVSAGTVTIDAQIDGPFCSTGCGRTLPNVYHVATGLPVNAGRGQACSPCVELSSTGECEAPELANRVWDGSVNHSDSTCTSDRGNQITCQTALTFAPPGRYRAEVCSLPTVRRDGVLECELDAEPRCESVEFDYPGTETVVIRLNNTPDGQRDAGAEGPPDAGPDSTLN